MQINNLTELLQTSMGLESFKTYLTDTEKLAFIGQEYKGYLIDEFINEGASGLVYRARRVDGQFERQVAIKFLNPGIITEDMQLRFLAEQKILAALQHQHIAQLFDAGVTENGIRYFIMEFVEGEHLDEWCISQQPNIDEKIALFEKITNAIGYAHSRQVIHRDIKPANIIINQKGEPKILDFGIAQSVLPEAQSEVSKGMTLRFASPEQVLQSNITTSSDIYQLGGILFYLLTNEFYFSRLSLEAIYQFHEQAGEPPLASEFLAGVEDKRSSGKRFPRLQRIKGDLEAILAKCLKHSEEERYATVYTLLEDISRFKEGLPVTARKNSLQYQLVRYLLKNRYWAAAGVVFMSSLLTIGTYYNVRLQQVNQEVEREVVKSQRVINLVGNLFESSSPFRENLEPPTIASVMNRAESQIKQDLQNESEVAGTLLGILAKLQLDLDNFKDAERLLLQALNLVEQGSKTPLEVNLAQVYFDADQLDKVEELLHELIPRLEDNKQHYDLLLELYLLKARAAMESRQFEAAIELAERVVDLAEGFPDSYTLRVKALLVLSDVKYELSLPDKMLPYLDVAENILVEQNDDDEGLNAKIANDRARAMVTLGKYQDAKTQYLKLLERYERFPDGRLDTIAHLYNMLARVSYFQGDFQQSYLYLKDAESTALQLYGEDHVKLWIIRSNMPTLLRKIGDYETALETVLASAEFFSQYRGGGPHRSYASTLLSVASLYLELGQLPKAEHYYQLAVDNLSDEGGYNLALAHLNLSLVLCMSGNIEDGKHHFNLAETDILNSHGAESLSGFHLLAITATCEFYEKRYADSLATTERAWALLAELNGNDNLNSIQAMEARFSMAKNNYQLGHFVKAREDINKVVDMMVSNQYTQSTNFVMVRIWRTKILKALLLDAEAHSEFQWLRETIPNLPWQSPLVDGAFSNLTRMM